MTLRIQPNGDILTRMSRSWARRCQHRCVPVAARLLGVGLLTLTPVFSAPAAAATARDMYASALARERALLASTRAEPPSLAELRTLIRAYEVVVHSYPRSGYSDNALWQAAGLALEAFTRFGEARDRASGTRLLALIGSEYPSSSLIPRIAGRLERFEPATDALAVRPTPILINSIERTALPTAVRVTIELAAEVSYHQERLEGPDRLFFDLYGTRAEPPLRDATLSFDTDVVRKIRLGRHPNDTTRVVLDLTDVAEYSVFTLYSPYRLVIDFARGPDAPAPALASTRPAAEPGRVPAPPTANSDWNVFPLSPARPRHRPGRHRPRATVVGIQAPAGQD